MNGAIQYCWRRYRACAAGLGCALGSMLFSIVVVAEGTESLGRPDLAVAKPQAACGLQELKAAPRQEMPAGVVFNSVAAVAEDPLANYARSPLGDWQMPIEVDRADPWLRFVLFAVKRPVVVDVAVFVDGKPHADGREAWIDGVLDQSAADVMSVAKTQAVGVATAASTAVKKKTIVPKADEPPTVSAQYRQAPDMRERLLAYVLQPGPAVDRREIRWLIAEWGFGPPVVVLDTSLSWQRAGVAPLLAYLDRDRSGALEAAEIAGAAAALAQCDADANDVVEESELRRKGDRPPVLPFTVDHPLVMAINDETDRDALVAELGRVYGQEAGKIVQQLDGAADVTLRVDFGTQAEQKAGVAVLAVGSELGGAKAEITTAANALALDLGGAQLEFSAAESEAANKDAGEAGIGRTQIAIGAAIDGNPLLRLVDGDQDRRLTRRERQQLTTLLQSLDRDRDGTVAGKELPIPIRFAVTLGPHVHTLLAEPTGGVRKLAPSEAAPPAPDWFVSMDKNGDHDLSRDEFLGTPEQFGQIDADADGLVSIDEAEKMGAGD